MIVTNKECTAGIEQAKQHAEHVIKRFEGLRREDQAFILGCLSTLESLGKDDERGDKPPNNKKGA